MQARFGALVLTAVAAGVACQSPGASPVPEARADETEARRAAPEAAAVVELFTSEGCSSCPPADEVLADLARGGAGPVYALAFHVDYWDELGWPDRFASPANTARQRAYARAFGARGLYTPQMVVGGTEELNGSDRARAADAIARAVRRAVANPSRVRLAVRPRAGDGAGSVVVDFDVAGAPADAVVEVALVERAASTVVRAGENAGRTLRHANVVRAFASAPLSDASSGSLALRAVPPIRRENGEVIALVQSGARAARAADVDSGGMPVVGAARAPLP
jgi:hypothetical protein